MNSESENFEQLRKLLALKRHEEPPPGYFDRFSGQVIARIRAGEQGDGAIERTWFYRFWKVVEAQPVFAGAFGAALCAVLVSGIVNSEESSTALVTPAAGALPAPTTAMLVRSPDTVLNTNITPDIKSLFDYQVEALPEPVNGSVDLLH